MCNGTVAAALSPTRNIVEISAVRVRDGAVTSMPFTARLSFVAASDSASLAGLPMVIEDPASVLGEEIEIRSTVRDMSGTYAMASKRVMIVWGMPICGALDGAVPLNPDGGPVFDGDGSVPRDPDAGPPPPAPDAG